MNAYAMHGIVILVSIVSYTVLTVTGHDGTPLLTFVGGQVLGAAIQQKGTGTG